MKGSFEINVYFQTKKDAEDAKTALKKEITATKMPHLPKFGKDMEPNLRINRNKRFSSKITLRGKQLIITVDAEDMVALRATANSFLRYLQVIEKL